MKIYNTLTKQSEELKPREMGKLNMFVCGPTVYDLIHIGNTRTFVFFDSFSKYLRSKGLAVEYLQNITDIDDKIINKAVTERKTAKEIAEQFEKEFLADMSALGVSGVTHYARATDHIPQVIEQVRKLRDSGHAYRISEGWYFDVKSFAGYGKLSGRTAQMAEDGVSRIDESGEKRNKADFCLWKFPNNDSEPAWDSEDLGRGRPGWHIEDTAITEHYFGPQYDIHGGGADLIFPHHEAEVAQQESASGLEPFVRYWMHVAFLINKAEKMSKSKGNFTTARRLLEKYSKETIRHYLFSADYRSPLEFSEEIVGTFKTAQDNIKKSLRRMTVYSERGAFDVDANGSAEKLTSIADELWSALDDNFNTATAIGQLNTMLATANQLIDDRKFDAKSYEVFKDTLEKLDTVLGIIPEAQPLDTPAEIAELIRQREEKRVALDWSAADTLRKDIESRGYLIDDTPYGPILSER
jgi:cysteinyl-tRNA synthetase